MIIMDLKSENFLKKVKIRISGGNKSEYNVSNVKSLQTVRLV